MYSLYYRLGGVTKYMCASVKRTSGTLFAVSSLIIGKWRSRRTSRRGNSARIRSSIKLIFTPYTTMYPYTRYTPPCGRRGSSALPFHQVGCERANEQFQFVFEKHLSLQSSLQTKISSQDFLLTSPIIRKTLF